MQEVQLYSPIISQDESAYEIDGMVNPEFHNDGTSDVFIQNQRIKPNSSFKAGLPNHVCKGTVNINFDENTGGDAPVHKVVLHYFKVIGPYVNPSTGLMYNEGEKTAAKRFNNSCN